MTSRVPTAAAKTIRVSMEEPALRSVSLQAFGTAVPVAPPMAGDTARIRYKTFRTTKQPDPILLDYIQLDMTVIKLLKFSVTLIQSLGLLGTCLNHLICPTKIFFRY